MTVPVQDEPEADEGAARLALAALAMYGEDIVTAVEAAFDETCLVQNALEDRAIA